MALGLGDGSAGRLSPARTPQLFLHSSVTTPSPGEDMEELEFSDTARDWGGGKASSYFEKHVGGFLMS